MRCIPEVVLRCVACLNSKDAILDGMMMLGERLLSNKIVTTSALLSSATCNDPMIGNISRVVCCGVVNQQQVSEGRTESKDEMMGGCRIARSSEWQKKQSAGGQNEQYPGFARGHPPYY